jgi:hypothetical protein
VTAVVLGVWTTVRYTTSTSTITVTGSTGYSTSTRYTNAKTIAANGNAQITTAQSKFGGASGLFNGNGAYLSTPDSADWAFGSGDFTIDFWVRFNVLPTAGNSAVIVAQYAGINNRATFFLRNTAGTYTWEQEVISGGVVTVSIVKTATVSASTWYHVALVRSGSSWYIFQDGTQVGTTGSDSDSVPDYAGSLYIGQYGGGGAYFNGWLDELRISKGVARWTSNFTPSTSGLTGDSNTVLLLHMDGADGSNTFIDG